MRTATTVSEPAQELELLRESVEVLTPSQFKLEYARSLIELRALLRRRDERVATREPLVESLYLAYRCGDDAIVTQALTKLRACDARPRQPVRDSVNALTPTETRVALLAAERQTNREIAQKAYVTLKTVKRTLSRTYAKLYISERDARETLPKALKPLLSVSSETNSEI